MKAAVDLVWLGAKASQPDWSLGRVWCIRPTPRAILDLHNRQIATATADAWLFWDEQLGTPEVDRISAALSRPGDLWHAGLRLGMAGLPGLIDFVQPTWMFNRDPASDCEATSWRLSLRACLVRTEVLRQLGTVRPEFRTLTGAGLELGYRYLAHGVFTRYLPWLAPDEIMATTPILPCEDELRFGYLCFGRKWSRWALLRAVATGYWSLLPSLRMWQRLERASQPPSRAIFARAPKDSRRDTTATRVSVIIPTLNRYPYLRTLLEQLRRQTIPPDEIIVIDQSPRQQRDTTLAAAFADLPLKIIDLERPGQCSSRNTGLAQTTGTHLLFLDDDDEIPADLIARHLDNLARFAAEVSCGVADEIGAGPLPENFRFTRPSEVFPAGNTMVRRSALVRSGMFDLTFDRGARADADLGMRQYLSGAVMVLEPSISVLHHHAPVGGLRAHGSRRITYASSRHRLTHRHLPAVTEIYLALRYFSRRQVREMIWLRVAGTFSTHGSAVRKMLKMLLAVAVLPHSLWTIRKRLRQARQMLAEFPQIPKLTPTSEPDNGGAPTGKMAEALPLSTFGFEQKTGRD